jgi:hypothetical protein
LNIPPTEIEEYITGLELEDRKLFQKVIATYPSIGESLALAVFVLR